MIEVRHRAGSLLAINLDTAHLPRHGFEVSFPIPLKQQTAAGIVPRGTELQIRLPDGKTIKAKAGSDTKAITVTADGNVSVE